MEMVLVERLSALKRALIVVCSCEVRREDEQ